MSRQAFKVDGFRVGCLQAKQGMNVKEFSERAGVSTTTITRARTGGRLSAEKICQITQALGCKPEEILASN